MTFAEATVKYFQTTKGQAFWKKYSSKTLVQEVADEMANVKTLPTIVAANLALERLVENGDVERTYGKNVDYDNAEIILAAQKRLGDEIAKAEALPLTRWRRATLRSPPVQQICDRFQFAEMIPTLA